ncbi:MAG TPA: hypothetical protein VHK63_06440, partial [Candidatus Limnocylindria bacterium]|nr:hypothetical protein [Candidatus Limnocylindria bacterium]
DADHGFGAALEQLLKVGDATMAHIAGLLWDGLGGSTPGPAARAGEEAATFFRQRGAAAFVDRFRAAFVPLAAGPRGAPAAEALAERPAAR